MVKSEQMKCMDDLDTECYQHRIKQMSKEELQEFRGNFNPDEMGFSGKEGIDE